MKQGRYILDLIYPVLRFYKNMKGLKILCLCSLIFIIDSCGTSKSELSDNDSCFHDINPELKYSIKKELSLFIGDTFPSDIFSMRMDSREEKLWLYSHNENQLNAFSTSSFDHVKQVQLVDEGPTPVGSLWDFLILPNDSILVYSGALLKLSLLDSQGNFLRYWTFGEEPTNPLPLGLSGNHMSIALDYSDIYMPMDESSNSNGPYTGSPLILYELPGDDVVVTRKKEFNDYPKEYDLTQTLLPRAPSFYYTKINDDILLSYPGSHYLHVYYKDSLSSICAKSNYTDKYIRKWPRKPSVEEKNQSFLESSNYLGIFHDRYRNLVYRIVKHGQTKFNESGEKNHPYAAKWSILVLNSRFEILGEVSMPPAKYNFIGGIAITKEGILISKENIVNEENDEKYLEFDLISIQIDK